MSKCMKMIAVGKVQGVGFRFSTKLRAKNLGISGYAKNLKDGSVEILACGSEENLAEFEKWLRNGGPKFAKI